MLRGSLHGRGVWVRMDTGIWVAKSPSLFIWNYHKLISYSAQVSSVQSLSHIQLSVIPWTAARQASLSIINSQSLLKLMSTELVMPSNHLNYIPIQYKKYKK